MEVAVGALEHVLFLGDSAFNAGAAADVGIGHIQHGEAFPVHFCEAQCGLTPVGRQHFDFGSEPDGISRYSPPDKILLREAVIGSGGETASKARRVSRSTARRRVERGSPSPRRLPSSSEQSGLPMW
ncbi:MAG: hypothetical protein P8141_10740 [Gammaproteobacteria bacterium]